MNGKPRPATLEEAKRAAKELGRDLGARMPPSWGFLLCLTQMGERGLMTYVSSCHRSTIPEFCRELADRLESGEGTVDVKAQDDLLFDKALTLLCRINDVLLSPFTQCRVDVSEAIKEHIEDEELHPTVEKMQEALDTALLEAREMLMRYKPELFDDQGTREAGG